LGPNDGAAPGIATVAVPLPAGLVKRLFVQVDVAPGPASQSDVFNVCVTGNCDTGITCTILSGQTECTDSTDTVTINDGDTLALQAISLDSAKTTDVTWSLEYQH
jgi:hypothetical protein